MCRILEGGGRVFPLLVVLMARRLVWLKIRWPTSLWGVDVNDRNAATRCETKAAPQGRTAAAAAVRAMREAFIQMKRPTRGGTQGPRRSFVMAVVD
jgi:hypothetical protein